MDIINYISLLFSELNKNSVKYIVLRNFEQLPYSTGGSDIDILVHKLDVTKFMNLMEFYVQANDLHLVSKINDNSCPKICLLNTSFGIQIDVFEGTVNFGGREFILSSVLFDSIIDYRSVKVLRPNVGALLAFLKELLNNNTCSTKYIIELQNQFHNLEIEPDLLSQFRPEFHTYLNHYLNELDDRHISALYQIAIKDFHRSKMAGFKNKLSRLFKQPGYTIAFLGTDGSGKSTIIESIKPPLMDAFHNAVYYEHMRPNKFPSIAKLLGNKEDFSGPVNNPHASSASGFFGSLFRWAYYMLDYTFGFYLKVWPKKAIRSSVWIFDRYYYDYLIDSKRGRIKLPNWILRFGQLIIPEPDIILCLGADASVIHQRKPELPLSEVERQVAVLKKFCSSHNRAVWIDTGQSVEQSSSEALHAIIEVMAMRFKTTKLHEK